MRKPLGHTFSMLRWIKNLGYPETIASATRFSPVSYPTLSLQVGSETEMAWAVKGGTAKPRATAWPLRAEAVIVDLLKR